MTNKTVEIKRDDGKIDRFVLGKPKFKHRNYVSVVLRGLSKTVKTSDASAVREKMEAIAKKKNIPIEELTEDGVLTDEEKTAIAGSGDIGLESINEILEPLFLCTLIETPEGPTKDKSADQIRSELDEYDYDQMMQLFKPALNFVIDSLISNRKKKE